MANALTIRPGYMLMQGPGGVFDSRNQHVRQVANVADVEFWMTQGPTIAIKVHKDASGWDVGYRYECGPRSVTIFAPFNDTGGYCPAAGFAVDKAGALT